MNKPLFKEIFELDPKDVENFIKEKYKKYFAEDETMKIEWCVPYNEFYIQAKPKLQPNSKYTKYSFRRKKSLSLKDYFDITFKHYHDTFAGIYGEITGKPVVVEEIGQHQEQGELLLDCRYNRKYVRVIKLKDDTWYCVDYDEKTGEEILTAVPDDLLKVVKEF